jgi:di/tripeptidase
MSERMLRQFMEMVQIDSESGNETKFLEYLLDEVTAIGGDAALDDYGNLLASFEAVGCEGVQPILLSCHGDTVKPGVGIDASAVFMTGFTDASIYNNRGIEMAVIGIGAQNEHSTDECIEVADMEKAVAALVEIFRLVANEA